MNILMIGNGFDLEHGLPTKYTDFLKFIKELHQACYSSSDESAIQNFEDTYFRTFIEREKDFYNSKDISNALIKLTYGNLWINYFINVHDEHLFHKENWIDFESEISTIVQAMDHLIKYYENYRITGVEDLTLYSFYMETLTRFIEKESLEAGNIRSNIKRMLSDLNRLICALEIYIAFYINNTKLQYYSPNILYESFDKVISFNYTSTYHRLYAVDHAETDCHFIHGHAEMDKLLSLHFPEVLEKNSDSLEYYMSRNNMVLGIDEYLSDDRKDKEVDFLPFKKYYQRIYKNTTSQYKSWLKEIDANPESNEQNTLHIFGHSLDVTDGDILRDFLKHNKVKTIIYYKTKQQLGAQITNLVKVLGSNAVIENVYGKNPSITFKEQYERMEVDSSFDMHIDLTHLKQMYNPPNKNIKYLLSRINSNIEQRNLKYFGSQNDVITLFDTLQRMGLGKKYFEKLLEIAYELNIRDIYDYQKWTYLHYDHSYKCDDHTTRFIDCINQHNSNLIMSDPRTDHTLFYFNHIYCPPISLDKAQYLVLVHEIFKIINRSSNKKYWHHLVQISCGPAKIFAREAIQELIHDADNDYDIISYNHLLHLMDEYEYTNENL